MLVALCLLVLKPVQLAPRQVKTCLLILLSLCTTYHLSVLAQINHPLYFNPRKLASAGSVPDLILGTEEAYGPRL